MGAFNKGARSAYANLVILVTHYRRAFVMPANRQSAIAKVALSVFFTILPEFIGWGPLMSKSRITQQTKKLDKFSSSRFLQTVTKGRVLSTYQKGQIIFEQGSPADAVFYIKTGKIKLTVISLQGKEAIVAILGADEFLGEGCLVGQPKRLATAICMSESVVMRVEKSEILRVLRDEPEFSQMFITHILQRNARVEEDLVDLLFNSTEKRLARALLLLANFGKEGRPEPIAGKISQEMLAEVIGTTRSRVSHFMNKFRKLGFIDYNGRLEVHSSLLSVVLAEPTRDVQPAHKDQIELQ